MGRLQKNLPACIYIDVDVFSITEGVAFWICSLHLKEGYPFPGCNTSSVTFCMLSCHSQLEDRFQLSRTFGQFAAAIALCNVFILGMSPGYVRIALYTELF